jgi:hypothetical protein
MKISGFTMVRNAEKYYFPIKESILSILPICDEFIIALGDNEVGDHTRELIESINSPKIKIYDRVWSPEDFVESRILAKETNFALSKCTGDWCFYLQADELVHENDLEIIKKECEKHLNNTKIEGLLFNYNHFFGDYEHYLPVHGWYKNEIRIVRNRIGVVSIKDAQSFRKENGQKLTVAPIEPYIYHYGWVRPPYLMQSKKKEHDSIHHGIENTTKKYQKSPNDFDYGSLGSIPVFKGSHPLLMKDFIANIFWEEALNYTKKAHLRRPLMKHEKTRYKIITWLENTFNGGKDFFGYSNWDKY